MRGPVERRHLVAVAHDDGEMVAHLQAHLEHRAGDRLDLCVPLLIGQPPVAVDNGDRCGLPPDRDRKGATKIHAQGPLLWVRTCCCEPSSCSPGKRSDAAGIAKATETRMSLC